MMLFLDCRTYPVLPALPVVIVTMMMKAMMDPCLLSFQDTTLQALVVSTMLRPSRCECRHVSHKWEGHAHSQVSSVSTPLQAKLGPTSYFNNVRDASPASPSPANSPDRQAPTPHNAAMACSGVISHLQLLPRVARPTSTHCCRWHKP